MIMDIPSNNHFCTLFQREYVQVVYSPKGFILITRDISTIRLSSHTVPVRICAGRVFSLRFHFDDNGYISH